MDFEYYFENAKECLGRPHVINDVLFKRTSFGHEYVQINYRYKHVEGEMYDPEGHFVSIFYNNKSDLEKILKQFTLLNEF